MKSANNEDDAEVNSARNSSTNMSSPQPPKVVKSDYSKGVAATNSNALLQCTATDLSNLPPLPSATPTANKRYQVGDAPISKADIGQKVDRFAKLVQERQLKNQASPIGNCSLNNGHINLIIM